MEPVYIVGVGMTPFRRHPDLTEKALTAWSVEDALRDAGITARDVQAAFYGNVGQGYLRGQHMIRGQAALLPLGLQGIPIVNVENACATASTALHLAVGYLRAGMADVALAVGTEKMFDEDKAKMFGVFDSGWDLERARETRDGFLALGASVPVPPGSESTRPYSPFMAVYAGFARQHMERHGTTQRQLAVIASKNHGHARFNERAQYRDPMSPEEVLAAPPVTYPLTLPMCSPISDGAAAVVVCSKAALKRPGVNAKRAVRVLACVVQTGSDRDAADVEHHCTALAARRAYARAGVGPKDISVAEVHDATAMGEVIQIENLGFCAFGDGGPVSERGDTTIGGRIPVNPSGGLESKGHPVGATGLAQLHELVAQLRGEAGARQVDGARIALAENGGGMQGIEEAVATVTILGH